MQKYIHEQCGILITEDKAYLIESRLAKLLMETGTKSFTHFYYNLCNKNSNKEVTQKIIDAITTNETQWFRDKTPWYTLEDTLLPAYINEIREGKRSRVRIWSAACATGQEPFSTAMCIDKYLSRYNINDLQLSHFEILATDISRTALHLAETGKYDNIAITRGLTDPDRSSYLQQEGRAWILDERLKKAVQFRHFNLQNSFLSLGQFDIIFCRYVTIYFSEEFRQEVFRKIASVLNPRGVLFLGNSEMFLDYRENFELVEHKGGIFYRIVG